MNGLINNTRGIKNEWSEMKQMAIYMGMLPDSFNISECVACAAVGLGLDIIRDHPGGICHHRFLYDKKLVSSSPFLAADKQQREKKENKK